MIESARRAALGTSLALVVALACASGTMACDGRPRSADTTGANAPRTGPAVAIVDLGGGVPEEETPNLLGVGNPKRSFDALLSTLDELEAPSGKGEDVGVLVKFGSATIGAARSQEIGQRLSSLRAHKKVFCQGDGFTNATMMAAARGCSKIFVAPAGEVATVGIAAQVVYMRRLLADELHLSIDFLQVGKYKGAEEPITRDGPSPEARESLTNVLTDMRASWLDDVAKGRTGGEQRARVSVEDGPYGPTKAKELGLIDEVGYADDALAALKAETSAVREHAVFGPGADETGTELDDLVRLLSGDEGESGPITLLRATGSIAMTAGGNGLLGGRGGIIEKDFDRRVRRLESDDEVKVVVLRLDSPGGSALASDLMWHHLMRLRKKKPLVVSVGDMAASGGMYLASAADFIFAEPMSIVGSIGVVGGKIAAGDALEKIGIHAETFPANAQATGASARAAYESPLVKWDDPTRTRVLESMTAVYELFLSRVAEGRSTRGRVVTRDQVAANAEGKIFSGRQGKELGLVDEVGGLSDALRKARELANLPADARVVVVGAKPTLFEALGAQGAVGQARRIALEGVVPTPIDVLERTAPLLVPFVTSVAPLLAGESTVVAMPYALTVK